MEKKIIQENDINFTSFLNQLEIEQNHEEALELYELLNEKRNEIGGIYNIELLLRIDEVNITINRIKESEYNKLMRLINNV